MNTPPVCWPPAILRRPDVQRHIGLSASSLYELIAKGQFPKPVPLGARTVGWLASEISKWVEERAASRE